MAITYTQKASLGVQIKGRKYCRNAVTPSIPLDQPGRLRISHLQALLSLSHTTVYQRIAHGVLPEPDGWDLPGQPKGKRGRPFWFTETIRPFVQPQGHS